MEQHEPIFNVPGVVLAVVGACVGVHVLLALLPDDQSTWLTLALAFIPARYSGYADLLPGGALAAATSFLTHTLVHGNFVHLLLNSAWLLVFGAAVAERTGPWRFLLLYAFCAIAGALTFLVFNPGLMVPVIGASGAISGLMGAAMRFLFSALDEGGLWMIRKAPQQVPLMPLSQALTDRRVVLVTLAFVGLNVLAVFGLGGFSSGGIAWEAHIGGYFAGFFAFGFFDRDPKFHSPDEPILN